MMCKECASVSSLRLHILKSSASKKNWMSCRISCVLLSNQPGLAIDFHYTYQYKYFCLPVKKFLSERKVRVAEMKERERLKKSIIH